MLEVKISISLLDDFFLHRPPTRAIKFRNYAPKDETLKEKKIPNAKPLSGL